MQRTGFASRHFMPIARALPVIAALIAAMLLLVNLELFNSVVSQYNTSVR